MGKKLLRIIFALWAFGDTLLCVSATSSQRAYFDKCQGKCALCPAGQRLCPTTNECIDEFKWCNGVQDCPDDEQGCEQLPVNGDGDVCRLLPNAAVCLVEGRSVKTFDGQRFTHDICDHVLLQDKVAEQFTVTAHRRCSRSSDIGVCESWVSVKCNSTIVKLGPTLSDVTVNGAPVDVRNLGAVSRRLEDVHLSRTGQRLVFTSVRHNFEVGFDERRTIKISVSGCLSSKTSGLCGLYDWDSKNEFRTPDDRLVSDARAFADSWAASGVASANCTLPTCPKQIRERAERLCQRIASPPLSLCFEDKGLPGSLVNSCADVVCDCLASAGGDKKCLCSAIEGFVSKCKTSERSQIASEWRLSLGCESNLVSSSKAPEPARYPPVKTRYKRNAATCAPYTLEPAQTLQYFTFYDRQRGQCYNTEPITNLAECRGKCISRTVFSLEKNNFTTTCRCCTIKRAVPGRVSLSCENGNRIEKDYQSPIECSCNPCGGEQTGSPDIAVPIPL